ncbi:MAG: nucleotidyltransferase domain-containing protein [Phormidesmis sp.]|mgnify:CR=1 FL=1
MNQTTQNLSAQCGLKTHVIESIVGVLKQHPEVDSAILYGSRAKGNFRPGSDIDLTLTGEALTYRLLTRIEDEIDDLMLPYLFDLSILRQIQNPNVVEHIYRVGLPFYTKADHTKADDLSNSEA